MPDEKFYYESAFYGDYIKPGEGIKVERKISFDEYRADLAPYVAKSISELTQERAASEALEREIFDKLTALSKEWAVQASQTLIIDKALDYLKIPTIRHTSNQWTVDKNGRHEISNMVYKMTYHISPQTSPVQKTPFAWEVSWELSFNVQPRIGKYLDYTIAEKKKKRYGSMADAEKYMQGRISTYAHLFTELSPPIPEDSKHLFRVNGHLLPGYTIAPHKPTPDELLAFVDDQDIEGAGLPEQPLKKTAAHTDKKHPKARKTR